LIDVINGFNFPGAASLVRAATRAVPHIERLAERARRANVPVIYVNDNFGQWRSDFEATIDACTAPDQPGREVSLRLRPHQDDYFVLKPRHSGFYSTTLELLLNHLGSTTLILTGFATHLCVLFTANDAHMRGYHLVVPRDCTASSAVSSKRAALKHVERSLKAKTDPAAEIDFARLHRNRKKPSGQAF
jgi:nicotinamidase-related amidase